ncbi:hypothetical protein BDB01DRAFT_906239 [Pilobolus umbonatus]|nr:hypothetical protein BDB01DRAFT_906239 [Pilobolus umbonatus]
MNTEAPINAGHGYANTAEDLEERELWSEAADIHLKAADMFKIAMKDAHDTEAIRTLRLLTETHLRKSNELKRRVDRLTRASQSQRSYHLGHNSMMDAHSTSGGLRHALPDRHQKNNSMLVSRMGRGHSSFSDEGQRMNGIGESYALLSNDDHEEDASDPFNKFLLAVEGLVDQLINPAVAFTSAPLNENDIPLPIQYETNEESLSNMMESFYIVPTANPPTATIDTTDKSLNRLEDYELENQLLKKKIVQLTKRMKTLEMSAEEGNMLKSSIIQFRNDVQRQAKRIMQSHHETSMRSSAASLLLYPGGIGGSTIHHTRNISAANYDLVSRLKELEDENRLLKSQNDKLRQSTIKYKERWAMLKENAKKRRATSTINEDLT